MDGMQRIERAVYGDGAMTRSRISALLSHSHFIGKVAVVGGDVVGHCIYRMNRDCKSVERFAVHPAYRRRGVGRAMLDHVMEKLTQSRPRLLIDVDEENLEGQLFLRACGVRAVAELLNERAIRFQYMMGD